MSFSSHGKMPKKKFKKIPDRWENYTNVGAQVEGTKFVAFKVPLHFDEDWNLDELKKAVPDLKHIIDLTNTNRYYHPSQCDKHGWTHKKIFVPGHVIPAKQYVEEFFSAVSEAMSEDGLIGVHCTHGLNRTGYMVCRYMIEKQGTDPDQAILAFDTARGHKQERENYLEHLKTKAWENETESPSTASFSSRPPHQSHSNNSRYDQSRPYHSGANRENNQWRQSYNRSYSHYDDNWRRPHDQRRQYDYSEDYREDQGRHHDNKDRVYRERPPHYGHYNSYNGYDGGYHQQHNQGYNRYPDDRGWYRHGSNNRGNQSRRGGKRKDYYETRVFTPSHHNRHRGSASSSSDSQSKSSE